MKIADAMKIVIAMFLASVLLNVGCVEEDADCLGSECKLKGTRHGDVCNYEYRDRINTETNRREIYAVYGLVECDDTDCNCRYKHWLNE